jgi:SnoaL-like domain
VVIDTLNSSDRVQLLEVYARSVMLLELERYADWTGLFGRQAVVSFVRIDERLSVEFKGHEALMLLGQRLMRGDFDRVFGNVAGPAIRARHHLTNITLFGDGPGCASGYAFLTVVTIGGTEPPRRLASGMYSDRLFKNSAGCWCFERRTLTDDRAITYARDAPNRVLVQSGQIP